MGCTNENLNRSKAQKNDEFYSSMWDIENELKYYTQWFRNKVIYCNCDDYRVSNFTAYFMNHFEEYGLRKLICTGYIRYGYGIGMIYDGHDQHTFELNGDGDFRSDECLAYLDEADLVITNPPFSLMKEYLPLMLGKGKDFLCMINVNVLTIKCLSKPIEERKVILGYTQPKYFTTPDGTIHLFGTTRWLTTLPIGAIYPPLTLTKTYDPNLHPKYDNLDAIECQKVKDIPKDYKGLIGVPITFLDKWCPNQFEIVRWRVGDDGKDLKVNGHRVYKRIVIRAIM